MGTRWADSDCPCPSSRDSRISQIRKSTTAPRFASPHPFDAQIRHGSLAAIRNLTYVHSLLVVGSANSTVQIEKPGVSVEICSGVEFSGDIPITLSFILSWPSRG